MDWGEVGGWKGSSVRAQDKMTCPSPISEAGEGGRFLLPLFFVLLKPSMDWREGSLLYWVHWYECSSHPETPRNSVHSGHPWTQSGWHIKWAITQSYIFCFIQAYLFTNPKHSCTFQSVRLHWYSYSSWAYSSLSTVYPNSNSPERT